MNKDLFAFIYLMYWQLFSSVLVRAILNICNFASLQFANVAQFAIFIWDIIYLAKFLLLYVVVGKLTAVTLWLSV